MNRSYGCWSQGKIHGTQLGWPGAGSCATSRSRWLSQAPHDEAQREEVSTCFYCKDGVLGECHGDRCHNWASTGIIEGVQLWLNHDLRKIDGGGQRRTSPQLAAGKQSYKLSFLAFHGGITQSYYIIDLDSAPPLSFRSQPCWIVTLWFPKLHRLVASAFVHLAGRISCKSEHFWMPVWSRSIEFCGSAISWTPWLANPQFPTMSWVVLQATSSCKTPKMTIYQGKTHPMKVTEMMG